MCESKIGFFKSNLKNIFINSGFSLEFRIGCSGWSYTSWTGPFHYAGFGPGIANLFRKMVGSFGIILDRPTTLTKGTTTTTTT